MYSRKNCTVSSRDVQQWAQNQIGEYLSIKDYGKKCTQDVLLKVLLLAAAGITSIGAVCKNLSDAPTAQAILAALRATLPDLATLERQDFRVGEGSISSAAISPDGEWALFSSASGRSAREVFLTRFPSGEGEWQVSIDGAWETAFSPDGSEIHFVDREQRLYRVTLQTEPEVILGAPELLGQAQDGTTLTGMSAAGSGRFLATQALGSSDGDLVIVLGWAAELAGR